MDAGTALEELAALSSQVVDAVVVEADGMVTAQSTTPPERAEWLAANGVHLLDAAARLRTDGASVDRVEVSLRQGSVYAVRSAERVAVATTLPGSTPGLVLYDLRTVLERSASEPAPTRRRTRARRQGEADA